MERLIVAIDAGYINFAVCAIRTSQPLRPVYWVNEPLFTGKFSEERLVHAIYAWINKPQIRELLQSADEIVLERQMAMKFQAVNHCVRFNYFNKTREVNPATIAALYGLGTTRREKKKAAVDLVSSKVVLPIKKGKKDDLCDAYLLALSRVLDTDKQLAGEWCAAREPQKKKTRNKM